MKTATKVVLGFFAGAGIATAVTVTAAGGHGWKHHGGEHMVGFVEYRLGLDEMQSDKLQQLVDQVQGVRSEWRDQREQNIALVSDLFAAPSLDQTAVLDLIESKTTIVNQQAPQIVAAMAEFSDSLNADQKQQVLDMIERRRSHRHGDD